MHALINQFHTGAQICGTIMKYCQLLKLAVTSIFAIRPEVKLTLL